MINYQPLKIGNRVVVGEIVRDRTISKEYGLVRYRGIVKALKTYPDSKSPFFEVEILEYQIVGKKDWKKYPKPFLKTYYRESLRISWGK